MIQGLVMSNYHRLRMRKSKRTQKEEYDKNLIVPVSFHFIITTRKKSIKEIE